MIEVDLTAYDRLDKSPDLSRKLRERREFRDHTVALWQHVNDSLGAYNCECTRSFLFNPDYLTAYQKSENSTAAQAGRQPPYSEAQWHNAVRLDNGTVLAMPLYPRPIMPKWMAVSTKEVE